MEALQKTMPDLSSYLDKGQIEIVAHTDWYLKGGTFDQKRVLDGWMDGWRSWTRPWRGASRACG